MCLTHEGGLIHFNQLCGTFVGQTPAAVHVFLQEWSQILAASYPYVRIDPISSPGIQPSCFQPSKKPSNTVP